MKNLGSDDIHNVSSSYELDSGSTYTYTWNVTFSAAMGDVPEMTIGAADADLSSVGADVNIGTVQVRYCVVSKQMSALVDVYSAIVLASYYL